jgi:hypothetical protein
LRIASRRAARHQPKKVRGFATPSAGVAFAFHQLLISLVVTPEAAMWLAHAVDNDW